MANVNLLKEMSWPPPYNNCIRNCEKIYYNDGEILDNESSGIIKVCEAFCHYLYFLTDAKGFYKKTCFIFLHGETLTLTDPEISTAALCIEGNFYSDSEILVMLG